MKADAKPGLVVGAIVVLVVVVGALGLKFLGPKRGQLSETEQRAVDTQVQQEYGKFYGGSGRPGPPASGSPGRGGGGRPGQPYGR